MTDEELRIEAEKRNRVVTDEGWEELTDQWYVQDAQGKDFDEDKIAEIVRTIDSARTKYWPTARVGGRSLANSEDGPYSDSGARPGPFAVDLAERERERALLHLEAQTRAAAKDARVRGFREHDLSGGLLAPEDAEQLLESGRQGLEALGSYLHKYYGMHEGEAKWWVLTGETPSARPVRVSYRTAESLDAPDVYLITIEAPPWISPATFPGTFVEMRRRMHAERKQPEARSVRVARFVERLRGDPTADNSPFQDMCRRWNEEHSDEAFSKSRSFEKAYERTAKTLRRQYNGEIEREQTPELRRQHARLKKMDAKLKAAHENTPK